MNMVTESFKFLREARVELSKVTWPTATETRVMSLMVFVLVVLIAIFLLLADWVIGSTIHMILGV